MFSNGVKKLFVIFFIPFGFFFSVGLMKPFILTMSGDSIDYYGLSIQGTSDQGYVISGYVEAEGPDDDHNVLISKFNSDGSNSWTRSLGGTGIYYGYSILETVDGGFIITGSGSFGGASVNAFLAKLDFDGSQNWVTAIGDEYESTYYGNSVQETRDGSFVVSGAAGTDAFLSKFNSVGMESWTILLSSLTLDYSTSVIETQDGGFVLASNTNFGGNFDIFVSKINSTGSHKWTKVLYGSNNDFANSVIESQDGSLIIAGRTTTYGENEIGCAMILKLSFDGTLNWVTVFGGIESDSASEVQETRDGCYIVTGSTSSFTNQVTAFVSKFNFDGTHNWTRILQVLGEISETSIAVIHDDDGDESFVAIGNTDFYADTKLMFLSRLESTLGTESINCLDKWVIVYPLILHETFNTSSNPDYLTIMNVSVTESRPDFPISQTIEDFELSYLCCSCFDISNTDSENVCSVHGDCRRFDTCECEENYFGKECEIHSCDGILTNSTDESVCSGHGVCTDKDECDCNDGYYSEQTFCADWNCDDTHYTNNVCNGHGECISPDNCVCDDGYESEFCDSWNCFGVESSRLVTVCNGHGECMIPDKCVCTDNYGKEDCSLSIDLALGLGISLPLVTVLVVTFLLLCGMCVILIFVIGCMCCCVVCLCGCVLIQQIFSQKKRIERFSKLKDFDLLLKEQELEELENYAKLNINKGLFTVEMDDIRTIQILGEGGSSSIVFKAEWAGKMVAYVKFLRD